MFLDQYHVMTLEFHYYQDDCKYSYVEAQKQMIDSNGTLVGEDGSPILTKFGLEDYQKDESSISPMSAFNREDIQNLKDQGLNIV